MFRSFLSQVFEVDRGGAIRNYDGPDCVNGSLEGQGVNDVLEQVRASTGGVAPVAPNYVPFASQCYDVDSQENL